MPAAFNVPSFTTPEDMAAEAFSTSDASTVRTRIPESFKAYADRANNHVTMIIRRYAETTPIERGTDMFNNLSRMATLYGCMLYFRGIAQRTQADQYAVSFKEAEEGIQDYLRTEPTGRQSSFAFTVSDREAERLVPYSQVGLAGDPKNLYS